MKRLTNSSIKTSQSGLKLLTKTDDLKGVLIKENIVKNLKKIWSSNEKVSKNNQNLFKKFN